MLLTLPRRDWSAHTNRGEGEGECEGEGGGEEGACEVGSFRIPVRNYLSLQSMTKTETKDRKGKERVK